MIYVRIELWPFGNQKEARLIGEVVVANVGGDHEHGEYEVRVSQEGGFRAEPYKLNSMTQSGKIRLRVKDPAPSSVMSKFGLKHERSRGIWVLLKKTLSKLVRELGD
jgi:hypothetical protein